MCRYCEAPLKEMQVSGGGRHAYARVDPIGGRVRVRDGEKTLAVRVKCCPMCGRRLRGDV